MPSLRAGIVSLGFVALFSTSGSAQRATCPKSDSLVARPCELDQWPLPDRNRIRPFYPDILRHAGVSGEVHLRYVVDTVGRTSASSMEELRSTHNLFTAAVMNAMPRQRFEPARRAGQLTSVIVEEVVTFVHPAPSWMSARNNLVIRHSVDSTGRLLTTVFAFTPRDSVNAPVLTMADSVEIYEAILEDLGRSKAVNGPPAAWCVQLDGRTPSQQMLERWRRNGRQVAVVADCPRTYTKMIRTPSDPDTPRGWIDPVYLNADSLVSWAEDTVIVTIRTGQGTVSAVNQCEVLRVAGKWAIAICVRTQWQIS